MEKVNNTVCKTLRCTSLRFLLNIVVCVKSLCLLPPSPDQGQSPAGKAVYPGGPGTKITSVSTGNLCADVSNRPIEARCRLYVEFSARRE